MKNKIFVLIVFLLLFPAPLVFSSGKKEDKKNSQSAAQPQIVRVTGIVRLVGNAMFPEIVITGDYSAFYFRQAENDDLNAEKRSITEWYISREEREVLNDLQQRLVTAEGEEIIIQMRFANGLPAGVRRELHNIRIISVH